jgi:hypothetical protein
MMAYVILDYMIIEHERTGDAFNYCYDYIERVVHILIEEKNTSSTSFKFTTRLGMQRLINNCK